MRYGFAIDQRTCIGCHACTVACKTEHEVPVGQFRTWVKYVDQGQYPATTREFGVLRCNHCTDAPCVTVCPTKSLFKREDGIVDFDSERCIGCKSCMQACPYDAIYIDEDTHTAAKCNFCAHRIDQNLEPACVVVCPTHSIWVGDLDDPQSGIAKLVATHPTSVRAPEQNTGPNLIYIGADRAVLDPLAAPVDTSYVWSRPDEHRAEVAEDLAPDAAVTGAHTTLNTAHSRPWGWRVTTYLWTKGVGAGALIVACGALAQDVELEELTTLVAPALAAAGTAVTGILLTWDLKRPDRVLYIFTKPNPDSWLFKGALVLVGYGAVSGAWLATGVAQRLGVIGAPGARGALARLRWVAAPGAALTAGYTAFLFGQAEGRDLWQSPQLLWQLLTQALVAGSGALLTAAGFMKLEANARRWLARGFVGASVAHLTMLAAEYGTGHETKNAATAARMITHGRYAKLFRYGAVGLSVAGAAAAVPALGGRRRWWAAAGGLIAQAGLLAYESVFVRAGQDVPLS
ncbi:MAG TPA: 4Fe-4S dicluster domain-containing protein [Solirubrobacteraceae bacterium]|nr:4Fe-4S dicluster domain-containing protein [Solirubrobacteraceae bacterium]